MLHVCKSVDVGSHLWIMSVQTNIFGDMYRIRHILGNLGVADVRVNFIQQILSRMEIPGWALRSGCGKCHCWYGH